MKARTNYSVYQSPQFSILSEDQKERIYNGMFRTLQYTGANVHHEGARELFKKAGCKVDGLRVYFSSNKFGHAFYESRNRDGNKNAFSHIRAQRIEWIRATLEHPEADLFQGWNKKRRCYDSSRRVSVVYEDFVVVISLGLKRDNSLKANFITCYQADNSIDKIRTSPLWSKDDCLRKLTGT